MAAAALCRKRGISDVTFYKWRSKYGGMEVSEAKRLKALEAENARKKLLMPGSRKKAVSWAIESEALHSAVPVV